MFQTGVIRLYVEDLKPESNTRIGTKDFFEIGFRWIVTITNEEADMSVKIFIKRHIKEDKMDAALSLLNQFRLAAMEQPGYISGETLVNHYDARSVTVVSTWNSVEDWIRWQESDERAGNEAQLEELLEQATKYEVYDVGVLPDKTK